MPNQTNPPPPPIRQLHFYKQGQLVLTVADRPGVLLSTAAAPPGGPPRHPFVDASAYDAASEGELGRLLRQSKSFNEFVQHLVQHGYDMLTGNFSAPMRLFSIYKLIEQDIVVAIFSLQGNGYAILGDDGVKIGTLRGFALTIYAPQRIPTLLTMAQSSHNLDQFLEFLKKDNLQVIEISYNH